MTDTISQEDGVNLETDTGEGNDDKVSISKKEYETFNQTIGSLKRELKDLKKNLEKPENTESKGTPKNQDDFGLLQKTLLRSVGVVGEDEIELAKEVQKKTNLEWDKLIDDDYFKHKLDNLRTKKANELATSNIRGGQQGVSETKQTPEYWLSKGTPPSRQDVPDRKTRAKIVRAFMENATSNGKRFYND